MSRSKVRKVQRTADSVERGHMDRISMNKEAGLALDARLKNSRCVVSGTGISHLAGARVRDRMNRTSPKFNSSWRIVLLSFDKDSKVI
jgi:hypothetical protein